MEQNRPTAGSSSAGDQLPNELAVIDQKEKETLLANIAENKYPRRQGEWQTRRDFGVREFLFRVVCLTVLYIFAYFTNPKSPCGREDKKWLQTFSIMMILMFAVIHALAYLPSAIFASFSDFVNAVRGRVSHAYANWRDYHYCAALMAAIMIVYPVLLFFALVVEGFNPYADLEQSEIKREGGMNGQIVFIFRYVLHLFLVIGLSYLTVMLVTMFVIRNLSRYPGHYTWVAVKMSRMPYGSLFF